MHAIALSEEIPVCLQRPVALWLEQIGNEAAAELDALPDALQRQTIRTVACSEFAAGVMRREWRWFADNVKQFEQPPDLHDLRQLGDELAMAGIDMEASKALLRQCRNRYLLRVLWRDVNGHADLDETLRELSLFADHALRAAATVAEALTRGRYGVVRNAAGDRVPLVIVAMGKLGGFELNFSSDIDLIFCFPEGGDSDGAKSIDAQEYFGRLSNRVIALLDDVTPDGFVFRIDTRLRPFGESGPPVVSFAALESYLLQHGRDWERYAYVKARIVGPVPPLAVADELYKQLIKPFVFRRYLDYGVFESLREMQAMIAAEVQRRELADNVKLGPGGIREAEFIVQALQLVRGGSEPELQSRQLQVVLPRLVGRRGLTANGAAELQHAYRFLRRLENAIQAIRDQQTHDLPVSETDRARLCLALGYSEWPDLVRELDRHREAVTEQFSAIAFQGRAESGARSTLFENLWESDAGADAWRGALVDCDPESAEDIAAVMVSFASSGLVKQIDATASERLQRLIPQLLATATRVARPAIALRRCLSVIEAVLRRSSYLALLNESRMALTRFVDLCERSQYIAGQLARHPVLLDELLDPRTYSESVTKTDLERDLAERVTGEDDSEYRMKRIAQFQRATMFRIAVADFNGTLPIMKVSDGLTWLAEAVLDEVLRVAWRDLARQHGAPQAGFAIIAYGKLGGLELSYGSDLDVIFLHDSDDRQAMTDGPRPLDVTMFFSRLVRRLLHMLTTQTGTGILYEIDTRLRPDGRSGVLVTSLNGFARYQQENAWTWEHQALLRARPVAGDPGVAKEFARIRSEVLRQHAHRESLREDVVRMRQRMRDELDRSNADRFDLKYGIGGVGDIEFLVQYLVLRTAASAPAVIEFSDNIRQIDALVAAGVLDANDGTKLQDIYRKYRTFLHHAALDDRPGHAPGDAFRSERDCIVELWQRWLG